MYQQELKLSPATRERTKNDGALAFGAFLGVAAGEYTGTYLGKRAYASDAKNQHYVSIAVKGAIGVFLLMLNSWGGMLGLLVFGIALGALGSIATDVFFLAGQGGLVGMAERAALSQQAQTNNARAAGQTFIEQARQTQTNINRLPQEVTTVSVAD